MPATFAQEPPEWAKNLDAFMRSQNSVAEDTQFLDSARDAGASAVDIGVAKMLRSLRSGDEDLFLAGWSDVGGNSEALRESELLALMGSDDEETIGLFSGLGHVLSLRVDGDHQSYRTALLDLVWEYPVFSDIIMSWEVSARERERMASLRIPLDLPFQSAAGEDVTLGSLMEGNEALLLDFHASWCGPCMNVLSTIDQHLPKLERNNVLLVGINTESLADARKVKERFNLQVPWLAEPDGRPLSELLRIQGIPTFVLVKPDGSVAFMDHALNAELDAQMESL